MKKISVALLLICCAAIGSAYGQTDKTYKEGQVTQLSYIKIKPDKFDDDMKFLDTTYKALMEANKKAGLIVGYAVYSMQARSPQEPDLLLTTTYANMAALDKIDEGDAVAVKIVGSNEVQNKAFIDREAMREVMGAQFIRELVLK